jgi:hypothetical protein
MVGGFIPEWRATSSRNGGRLHLGMVGDFKSESWATSLGTRKRATTELSYVEINDLFRQQIRVLREWRNSISADITASQERIKQSRALLAQLDEQINRMERELGWFGGR